MKANANYSFPNKTVYHWGGRDSDLNFDFTQTFLNFYNSVPNEFYLKDIDIDIAYGYLTNKCFIKPENVQVKKKYSFTNEGEKVLLCTFFYKEELIINLTFHKELYIFYNDKSEEIVQSIFEELKNIVQKQQTSRHIFIALNDSNKIQLKKFQINEQQMDLAENYNSDFIPIDETIVKKLNEEEKGIVLFHGLPGTGKTSYIRYLIGNLNKKVIFLPPNLAGDLTSPTLMSLFIDNKNSIVVIEDAEWLIQDRGQNVDSPVSAILNTSDGILSDVLKIQFICTFNNDISKIDNALLRRGRLIAKYRFEKLSAQKASNLSKKLGHNIVYHEPQCLTDIYNPYDQEAGEEDVKIMGFRRYAS